jgi:excisionase family DNA binding protein
VLTVSEAAEYLRTSTGAVYKRIERGQLDAHRPEGSPILLRRADLDALWTSARPGPMMTTNSGPARQPPPGP